MARPKRKISQSRLARELGISQALVSLALNGRRQGVHTETYDRIWSLALQRGYRPKGMHLPASPASVPGQIALIFAASLGVGTPSPYFTQVQQGLHSTFQRQGLATVFIGTEDRLDLATLQRAFPADHAFRGVILLGEVSRRFLDRLRVFRLPVVSVTARHPGLSHSVVANEDQALGSLVKHLHALGHRRLGWIGGNLSLPRHDTRLRAFETSLEDAGLELNSRYCLRLSLADRAEGTEAVHTLKPHFARRDFPTAFICYNTLMAAGALRAFEREGRSVPRDLSLASADYSSPPLSLSSRITAAGSKPEKIGEAAARLLMSLQPQASDDRFTDLVIPALFSSGDTTGIAPKEFRAVRPRDATWTKTIAA